MDMARLAGAPEGLILAGACAALLGVLMLLGGKSLRTDAGGRAARLLPAFVAAGAAAAAFFWPPERWAPALAFSLVWGLGCVLRARRSSRAVLTPVRLAGHPFVQSVTLILLGFGSILGYAAVLQARTAPSTFGEDGEGLKPPVRRLSSQVALTDMGREVPLYELDGAPESRAELERAEERAYVQRRLEFRIIRTGPAAPETNCHGWVFTGGTHWLPNDEVEHILMENAYVEVFTPKLNDLVVYRGEIGEIIHTGVVRAVDGRVLIESKWGKAGLFLHQPDESLYPPSFQYFRTSRGGHLLNGPYTGGPAGRFPARAGAPPALGRPVS